MPPEDDEPGQQPLSAQDAQGFDFGVEAVPADEKKKPSPHAGHRERLRERFLNAGEHALADHEVIELLLFSAIPRQDTKPFAKRLIERFGSYEEVFAAPPHQLREIFPKNDMAIAVLKAVEAAAVRMARKQVLKKPLITSFQALIEYCQTHIARNAVEQFRVLLLDKKNRLIEDRLMGEGTVDHAPVYPREILKRVGAVDACSVILVHNHPSGDPTPSSADIEMTRAIVTVLKPINVPVHDHLIISRTGHTSFREKGLL